MDYFRILYFAGIDIPEIAVAFSENMDGIFYYHGFYNDPHYPQYCIFYHYFTNRVDRQTVQKRFSGSKTGSAGRHLLEYPEKPD